MQSSQHLKPEQQRALLCAPRPPLAPPPPALASFPIFLLTNMASGNPKDDSSEHLPSFSNLLEHLSNPMTTTFSAATVQRTSASAGVAPAAQRHSSPSSSSSQPSPPTGPRNPNAALYSFRALPAPIRLAHELQVSSSEERAAEVKMKPPAFGVLVRSDRASPAGPASRRMRDVEEPEFECDRCGATKTPEKRYGPCATHAPAYTWRASHRVVLRCHLSAEGVFKSLLPISGMTRWRIFSGAIGWFRTPHTPQDGSQRPTHTLQPLRPSLGPRAEGGGEGGGAQAQAEGGGHCRHCRAAGACSGDAAACKQR